MKDGVKREMGIIYAAYIFSYCCLYLSVDYGIIENSCVSIATAVFLS